MNIHTRKNKLFLNMSNIFNLNNFYYDFDIVYNQNYFYPRRLGFRAKRIAM
jgi:hypothetical protein